MRVFCESEDPDLNELRIVKSFHPADSRIRFRADVAIVVSAAFNPLISDTVSGYTYSLEIM